MAITRRTGALLSLLAVAAVVAYFNAPAQVNVIAARRMLQATAPAPSPETAFSKVVAKAVEYSQDHDGLTVRDGSSVVSFDCLDEGSIITSTRYMKKQNIKSSLWVLDITNNNATTIEGAAQNLATLVAQRDYQAQLGEILRTQDTVKPKYIDYAISTAKPSNNVDYALFLRDVDYPTLQRINNGSSIKPVDKQSSALKINPKTGVCAMCDITGSKAVCVNLNTTMTTIVNSLQTVGNPRALRRLANTTSAIVQLPYGGPAFSCGNYPALNDSVARADQPQPEKLLSPGQLRDQLASENITTLYIVQLAKGSGRTIAAAALQMRKVVQRNNLWEQVKMKARLSEGQAGVLNNAVHVRKLAQNSYVVSFDVLLASYSNAPLSKTVVELIATNKASPKYFPKQTTEKFYYTVDTATGSCAATLLTPA